MPLDQELILLTVQHPGEKPMMRKMMMVVMTEATLFKKGAIGREVPLVGPNLKLGQGTEHDVVVLCWQLMEEKKNNEDSEVSYQAQVSEVVRLGVHTRSWMRVLSRRRMSCLMSLENLTAAIRPIATSRRDASLRCPCIIGLMYLTLAKSTHTSEIQRFSGQHNSRLRDEGVAYTSRT
jgi:hypothetical protein